MGTRSLGSGNLRPRAGPGAGLVQPWNMGANLERLPMIRAVAEYGLLREAVAQR